MTAPAADTAMAPMLEKRRIEAAILKHVYDTLKALRDGVPPKELKGLPSAQLTGRAMREADVKVRSGAFLGLKKP